MNSKLSTGYLTPQLERKKKSRRSGSANNNPDGVKDPVDSLFDRLMSCPTKRKQVLQLLASEKDAIEAYKKNEMKKRENINGSPILKVKKKVQCESPTALFRRRALEQKNVGTATSPAFEKCSSRSSSRASGSSRQSNGSSPPGSPVPFDKVFDGVVAYVEIRSKDQDKSSGMKGVLRSMGATVKEVLKKGVTHVVFKDGLFSTYQKAKLLNVHLVSVLWVDFSRKAARKQPEKMYPAVGAQDSDASTVCSQMYKEYEEIIRDEYRQSLANGTPLPSTKHLIQRRRTLMASSSSSYHTAELSSQESNCSEEVAAITSRISTNSSNRDWLDSPTLVLNSISISSDEESDTGAIVNGVINHSKSKNKVLMSRSRSLYNFKNDGASNMELTHAAGHSTPRNMKAKHHEETSDMEFTNVVNTSIGEENISHAQNTPIVNDKHTKSCDRNDHRSWRVSSQSISVPVTTKQYSSQGNVSKSDDSSMSVIKSSIKSIHKSTNHSVSSKKSVPVVSKKITQPHARRNIFNTSIISSDTSTDVSKSSDRTVSDIVNEKVCDQNDNSKPKKSSENVFVIPKRSVSKRRTRSSGNSSSLFSSDSSKSKSRLSPSQTLDSKMQGQNSQAEVTNKLELPSSAVSSETSTDLLKSSGDSLTFPKKKIINTSTSSTATRSNSSMSSFRLSDHTNNSKKSYQKEKYKEPANKIDKTCTTMSSLCLSSDKEKLSNKTDTTHTTMSSLRLSSDKEKLVEKSTSTNMSSLRVSETQKKHNTSSSSTRSEDKRSFASDMSPCKLDEDVVNRALEAIKSPSYVTTRKGRSVKSTSFVDDSSDDSEIISPAKSRRKQRMFRARTSSAESDKEEASKSSDNIASPIKRRKKSHEINGKHVKKIQSNKNNRATKSANSECESNNGESSTKNSKRLRKLYNPDSSFGYLEVSDDKERAEKRTQKKRNSNEGVFLNPNSVNTDITTNKSLLVLLDESLIQKEIGDAAKTSKKPNKKKEDVNKNNVNSDEDEQRDLLTEIVNNKIKTNTGTSENTTGETVAKRRQSTRLKKRPKKLGESDDENSVLPITPIKRRSTMDFQPSSQRSTIKKLNINRAKQPSIACTKLHKADVQVFARIVKKLGRFVVEDEVSSKTTHLVAGEAKRTINMLRAVARGCWVLKYEWVLKSLEEGRWLPEEDFEDTEFGAVVQQSRLQRQAFGPTYSLDVFENCGPIYISRASTPRASDLRELVTLCKGKVVTSPRMAKIVVGEYYKQEGVTCVLETWVLDCITFNKSVPLKKKYFISTNGRRSIVV